MHPSRHPDAYRLITYRADPSARELVWNPRNAAAPATIELPNGRIARRVAVHEPLVLHHTPSVGHVILVDCSEEWAHQRAESLARRLWAEGNREFSSEEELEAHLLELFMVDVEAHHGVAVAVTQEMAAHEHWAVSA